MINAERFIGDEELIDEFNNELADHLIERFDGFWKDDKNYVVGVLEEFFKKEKKDDKKDM